MSAKKKMNMRLFADRGEWREWLEQHHSRESVIWLIYYRKHLRKPALKYEEAVEEALCFGWIDSTVRRIDEERYMQRFTPRKKNSGWSASNRARVADLISSGRMTPAGLAVVEAAKLSGAWNRLADIEANDSPPPDLQAALARMPQALDNFNAFTRPQRIQYIWWLESARREETRRKRLQEIVRRSQENIKPG